MYDCNSPPANFPASSTVPCLTNPIGTTHHTLIEGAAPFKMASWSVMYSKCLLTTALSLVTDPVPIVILDPATGKVGTNQKDVWFRGKGISVCTSFTVFGSW